MLCFYELNRCYEEIEEKGIIAETNWKERVADAF